ncbi:hypothetical protein V9T40_012269 [Parthenolecanium corni]|uniref:Uncharacterized protein n=1 Tax=Parthenolecanium corni TaxID=536013 RepID=A0AAN9T707_9HEMI
MYLEKCNETQLKEIYREFNITEESLKRDVKYLMEWMEKQPHLPNVKENSHLLTPEAEMKATCMYMDINSKDDLHRTNIYLYDFRNVNMNLMTTMFTVAKKYPSVYQMVLWTNEKPDFTSILPAEVLPEDYGGKEKPLKQLHEMYYQYVCGFREWLKSDEDMKADLSKRTDGLYKISLDESVDGSFRQLIID